MSNQQMESRFTFCFGPLHTHVQKGAFVFAILGAVINLAMAIGCNVWYYKNIINIGNTRTPTDLNLIFFPHYGMVYLSIALVHVSIIVAQLKRDPSYYLPYLIVVGNSLVLGVAFCPVNLVYMIIAPTFPKIDLEYPPQYKAALANFRLVAGLTVLFIAVSIALNGWFYSVVYRAYKFMKEQQGQAYMGEGVPEQVQVEVAGGIHQQPI